MIKGFYSKNIIKNHFFIKVLIKHNNGKNISNNLKIWTYYNIGMFKTVMKLPSENLSVKALISKIVSHAACGDFIKARRFIELFKKENNSKKLTLKLAKDLSPYMPNDTERLITEQKNSLLYAAILLEINEEQKAFSILYKLLKEKKYRKKPEVLLYFSNAKKNITFGERIKYLNIYLNLFNIPKVKLKTKNKFLNVMNITTSYNKEFSSDNSLVSVLMTAYNSEERIATAIESILNQTYRNLELIIVDDASKDNTVDIVKSWIKKDKRVKLITLKVNVGTYVAKNIALLKSNGQFITCHDSDDWSHPIKIQRQIEPLLKNKRLIATISSWIRIDDSGNYYTRSVYPLSRMNASSLLFRKKDVLENAGVWDCVRTGADSEYIARLKIIFGRQNVKTLKDPLSFGSHRENSLMTASDTGYCKVGMSPQRLDYWESWNKWHIDELSKKKKPKLEENLLLERKFHAPDEILISKENIKLNLLDSNL